MIPPARARLVSLYIVASALAAPAWRAAEAAAADPLILTEQATLKAPDSVTTDDGFGYAIAISGDTAVVGSPTQSIPGLGGAGAVYVFVRHGSHWYQQAKLMASDAAWHQSFGLSAAISGDIMAVASSQKVYIFERSGSVWYEQAQLVAVGPFSGFSGGNFLAISEDTLVVGAAGYDEHKGTVHIYVRDGSSWISQAQLFAPDDRPFGFFGTSVAISGDTLVVGASSFSIEAGKAFVFTRGDSTWSLQATLLPAVSEPADRFGRSVAISAQTAAVGAPYWGGYQGAVDVFVRSGATWSHQARLLSPDGGPNQSLGTSVALQGDTLVTGGPSAGGGVGSAYLFTRRGSLWSEQNKLLSSDGERDDHLGSSVALSGHAVFAGTWKTGFYGGLGAVYLFPRAGFLTTPSAGLYTFEKGGTATFTVLLSSQPVGEVVIDLASTNTDEGTVSPAQLTFTPDDWSTPQTVTLTGVDDFAVDHGQPYTVVLSMNTDLTEDAIYDGIDPPDVSAVNLPFEGDFYTVTPCRVLDTRLPEQEPALASGVERAVTFHGVCDIPTTARAVAISVAVVNPMSAGQLTLYPTDLPQPGLGTAAFAAGRNRTCSAIVLLAADGTGTLTAWPILDGGGSTHLVIDVSGYFE